MSIQNNWENIDIIYKTTMNRKVVNVLFPKDPYIYILRYTIYLEQVNESHDV